MASPNIRVIIPDNVIEKIELSDRVIAKHLADGAGSQLLGLNMADFEGKNTISKTKHALAKQLERDAENATEDRDLALGIHESQNAQTPGTVDFYLRSIRDVLLGLHKGQEQNLGDWGFVVDTSPKQPNTP